jgi:hypothetical protein
MASWRLIQMKHNILITTLLTATLVALRAAEPAAKPAWGDQGDGTYRNPILWADYNNPCVFKAGDTFYLTCASHHFMGMPLLASITTFSVREPSSICAPAGGCSARPGVRTASTAAVRAQHW